MKRVGFIINGRVPAPGSLFRGGLLPHHLLTGWDDSASPMSFMRFRWIAREAARQHLATYELYRPWQRYDAVVFLKSMGASCFALLQQLQARGTRVIFEANVDYYSETTGQTPFSDMAPTAAQRAHAIAITSAADTVIASSRHLADICRQFNPRSHWVPDNIPAELIPPLSSPPKNAARLDLWWSGMAAKSIDFLCIGDVLRRLKDRLHLHLVTDDFSRGCSRWSEDLRHRMDSLLSDIPHTLYPFRSIPDLLALYAGGQGVIVSPRFLDNPYNLSHSEWKISLGLACGLPAVVSPVPSYGEVAERASSGAIRLCPTSDDWSAALSAALDGSWDLAASGHAAREVVEQFYRTDIVARQHVEAVLSA